MMLCRLICIPTYMYCGYNNGPTYLIIVISRVREFIRVISLDFSFLLALIYELKLTMYHNEIGDFLGCLVESKFRNFH